MSDRRSRTECSLGHLAHRFVTHLPRHTFQDTVYEFSVQEVKAFFNAKETAVYDMLSILESILLVTKIGKQSYQWNGLDHLERTLALLRSIALAMHFEVDLKEAQLKHRAGIVEKARAMMGGNAEMAAMASGASWCATDYGPKSGGQSKRKFHFLEEAQRFLMMFLVSGPSQHLSMPVCYTAIFKDDSCETRRLYDIANVLSGLPTPILRRTIVGNKVGLRKREFVYCGPDVMSCNFSVDDLYVIPEYRRKNMVISKGLKLLNIPERPSDFPGCHVVRVVESEDGLPKLAEGSEDLYVKSVPLARMNLTQDLMDFVSAIY